MRRLWTIATLALLLAVPSAYAQRRGGSMGVRPRMGPSFSRPPVAMNRGPVVTGFHHGNGAHIITSFNHPHHHHRGFSRFGAFYYPYYAYPWYWDSASSYDASDAYYEQTQQLSQQLNELSNEVAQLREEQQIRSYVPPQPQVQPEPAPAKPDPAIATVLVFQDQHREEIQNYAVVGHTLWVFNQDRARKIPLAQLDLPATSKANDDRGVDFTMPR